MKNTLVPLEQVAQRIAFRAALGSNQAPQPTYLAAIIRFMFRRGLPHGWGK